LKGNVQKRGGLGFFLCIFLSLSACHRTEPVPPDKPQVVAGVQMQDVHFHSAALNREMPYRVFLPNMPHAGQKLPVIYLLHGGGGGFHDWSNYSDIAKFAQRNIILVMPEGDSSYFMNEVEAKQDRYEDYVTEDLVEDVESRFPASTDRKDRAIVGVSMGGFAAIKYALTRPGLFAFAGAISPAVDVPSRHFSWKHADQWWRFRRIFGPMGSKDRLARDPFALVLNANAQSTPYLYLTAGEQEPLLEPIRRFAAHLRERGFAYEFHTKPGGHDWGEWNRQIPDCFTSLFQHLSLDPTS
jgi:putative tributyrin esterase